MSSFAYTALDGEGRSVTGHIEAPGRGEAIAQLAQRRLFVTEIAGGPAAAPVAARGAVSFRLGMRRRVRPRARAAMLRQLGTALQAGLPLLSALKVVQEQAESPATRLLMEDVAGRVQGGESLSEAMKAHPREFSALEASMVRVGETAGVLDQVMTYISDFAERDVETRQRIRTAATYPAFVLGLAGVSVIVIVTCILPRVIATVTEGVGTAALPTPTRILMGVSGALTSYGWLMLAALAGAVWGFRSWVSRPQGRLAFDSFKLRVPLLGNAIRRIAVARFARTLGTLSKSGIQILESLRVMRDTLGNEALARKIDRVADSITQGESIAEPLRQTGEFPPLLTQVIAMGEKTGRLDELLLQTADAYEKDTAAAIDRVMTILPAMLIVLLALVVAFILSAVLLPIIEMQTNLPGM
jgi:type II secretory pathway component PulF